MSQTPEWIGYILLFFTVFCVVSLPTVIIIYVNNYWKNKRDPEYLAKTQNKKLSKTSKIIRSSAGVLMVVLGCILFIWPFYRIFILKDIPYELSVEGMIALISDLVMFFGLPLTLITIGRFYFISAKAGGRIIDYDKSL